MIFLTGGTKDSRELAEKLLLEGLPLLVSTATEEGRNLLGNHYQVISGKLNSQDMEEVIDKYQIKILLDGSHPYAKEVSMNAIKACENKKIPFLRYERKRVSYEHVKKFSSFEEISEWLSDKKGNILLTTGSNNLKTFLNIDKERLYIRVLPVLQSIKKCEDLGFSPSHIMALQGPFSKEFNRILYREYHIKYVVMKDSGHVGGTPEKIDAALEEGVDVLMLERPVIDYPAIYDNMDEVIAECKRILNI